MRRKLHRRDFLVLTAGAAAWPWAGRLGAAPPAPGRVADTSEGLSVYQLGPQIWIRWDSRLLTCYRAHRTQKYPYLYPLAGPLTGLSLTAETSLPWPHHRSLFFGCDRVNGGNYWQEGFEQGQILSSGPRVGRTSQESVEILDDCDWQKPGGPVVLKDARRIIITVPTPRLRCIDWEIRWQAVEDVRIAKTNHSLFAARAAPDLAPSGGGRLLNAEGESGEKGTFGKKSAWCDFSGPRPGGPGGLVEGLALMDHPANPWAPTPWFTRDYGFMSPTPFNFVEKDWELAAGKALTLRYRVVLHAGDAKAAGLEALFKEWAGAG